MRSMFLDFPLSTLPLWSYGFTARLPETRFAAKKLLILNHYVRVTIFALKNILNK